MKTTKEWAKLLNISVEEDLAPIPDFSKPYARSARDVAVRAVILQGVVAVACEVEPQPVVAWFQEQEIWSGVTPRERDFLLSSSNTESEQNQFQWKQEAEWALLWMAGKVESLGLPTHQCDSRRLVDEIIPALGGDIRVFVESAKLRSPGALLAEDDRTYDLWCHVHLARRKGEELPKDLNLGVLKEWRYAFEWMDGFQAWDDVTCDA